MLYINSADRKLFSFNSQNLIGGITTDMCGCCPACAKVVGEKCGGPWFITGVCDKGLECKRDLNNFNSIGVCVKARRVRCKLLNLIFIQFSLEEIGDIYT